MRSLLPATLACLACAAESQEMPSIEIAGVTITRGMPEKNVREAFRAVSCDDREPNSCSVGDGVPPEYDGDITFENGQVRSAARNLTIPEKSEDALFLLQGTIERLAGASQTCAKIQVHSLDNGLKYVTIAWPDKAIWMQVHESWPYTMIKETLRPASSTAQTDQVEEQDC